MEIIPTQSHNITDDRTAARGFTRLFNAFHHGYNAIMEMPPSPDSPALTTVTDGPIIKGLVIFEEPEGTGHGPCHDLWLYAIPRAGEVLQLPNFSDAVLSEVDRQNAPTRRYYEVVQVHHLFRTVTEEYEMIEDPLHEVYLYVKLSTDTKRFGLYM